MLPRINFKNFNFFHRVACVGSVSNRVIARKLERSKKKKGERGRGRREEEEEVSFFPLPLPRHSFFFSALVPTFSTESRGNACYAGYSVCSFQLNNNFVRFIDMYLFFSQTTTCKIPLGLYIL